MLSDDLCRAACGPKVGGIPKSERALGQKTSKFLSLAGIQSMRSAGNLFWVQALRTFLSVHLAPEVDGAGGTVEFSGDCRSGHAAFQHLDGSTAALLELLQFLVYFL